MHSCYGLDRPVQRTLSALAKLRLVAESRTTHIAQNIPETFQEPSVKTKETSQLQLLDG